MQMHTHARMPAYKVHVGPHTAMRTCTHAGDGDRARNEPGAAAETAGVGAVVRMETSLGLPALQELRHFARGAEDAEATNARSLRYLDVSTNQLTN